MVWQVIYYICGRSIFLGHFQVEDEAARFSDLANWFLQDFRKRRPKFNFPEQLPPPGPVPPRIAAIRRELLNSGCPHPFKHHPGWIAPELS
jgi:hypothetical protein